MKKIISVILSLAIVASLVGAFPITASASTISIENLRVNSLVSPLGIDKTPRFSWVNNTDGQFGKNQTAYQIKIYNSRLGAESGLNTDIVWNSNKTTSNINYDISGDLSALSAKTRYFWTVTVWIDDGAPCISEVAEFGTGMFQTSDWSSAEWITMPNNTSRAATLLRQVFAINEEKQVAYATAYVSGLGLFDFKINGENPDNSVLNPANTDYDDTVPYCTYDITDIVENGDNAFTVELGNGFYYSSFDGWNWSSAPWKNPPTLLLNILVKYTDGTSSTLISDENWKASKDGPIIENDIYFGDVYDARKEIADWTTPNFDASSWTSAGVATAPKGRIQSQNMEPMRRQGAPIVPESVTKLNDGSFVVKMPKVMTGWLETTFNETAGTEITMLYGEKLNSDGSVIAKYDGKQDVGQTTTQTDKYIAKAGGAQTYEPKFSYKGFQYVHIKGARGNLTPSDIVAHYIYNDIDITGEFSSSNELINDLHAAMVQTSLNNFQGKPTDTPYLEKNGWLGDVNVGLDTFSYNFGLNSFLEKFMGDIVDTQNAAGDVTGLAPVSKRWGRDNVPVWTSVLFALPENLSNVYGNKTIVKDYYEKMKLTAENYRNRLSDNDWIWNGDDNHDWSDWVSPMGGDSLAYREAAPEGANIYSTAYLYKAMEIMEKFAREVNEPTDEANYRDAKENIKTAFNNKYYKPNTGIYESGFWDNHANNAKRTRYRQSANIVPLAFGITDDSNRETVIANLIKDIKNKDYHLDTGIIGTKYILPLLEETGHSQVAYKILTQTTYPSWGYWIENGATTMHEMWEKTSRSLNHFFLGTFDEWLYSGLSGIRDIENGYENFTVKPNFTNDLSNVSGKISTVRGEVESSWKTTTNGIKMTVKVPTGSTASIHLPTINRSTVTVNGDTAIATSAGVKSVTATGGNIVLIVGSGKYEITSASTGKLEYAIRNTDDFEEMDYNSTAWATFQTAKTTATSTLSSDTATAATISTALTTFNSAVTTLEANLNQDRLNLKNYIASIDGKINKANYPTTEYNAYLAKFNEVKPFLTDGTKTDAQLLTALNELKAIVENLLDLRVGNLAKNTTVTASSSVSSNNWSINKVVDGNRQNKDGNEYCGWSTSDNTGVNHTEWLQLDLGMDSKFNQVVIYPSTSAIDVPNSCYAFPEDFTISVSNDGTNWRTVVTETGYPIPSYGPLTFDFTQETAHYIKFEGTKLRPKPSDGNTYRIQLAEFEVYNATIPDGVVNVDNKEYIYKDGKAVENQMTNIGDDTFYCNASGMMEKSKAITIDGKIYYFAADGKLVKSTFYTHSQRLYYANADGARAIDSWIIDDGKEYYMNSVGTKAMNQIISQEFYVNENGEKQKGKIVTVLLQKYILSSDGKIQKNGVITFNKKKYYADPNGMLLCNAWVYEKNVKRYRTDANGALVTNKIVSNTLLGANGQIVKNKAYKLNKKTYFTDGKGVIKKNKVITISGKTYCTDKKGVKITKTGIFTVNKNRYYLKKGVAKKSGWIRHKKKWYRVGKKCALIKGRTVRINKKKYKFDKNGVCKNK